MAATSAPPSQSILDRIPVLETIEHRGRAMGSELHLIATADRAEGPAARGDLRAIVNRAVTRIDRLEQRWSRFLASSEVTRLNNAAGSPVEVSDDTVLLVRRAVEARHLSQGRFDPTLLQAMRANGYDRTFVAIKTPAGGPAIDTRRYGFGHISIDERHNTITLAAGAGFDPGGIGKGLAADIVAVEMINEGARGALVNVGGDLRCLGTGPAGRGWIIEVGDVQAGVVMRTIELAAGGVATSTPCRRAWKRRQGGRLIETHHLLEPETGQSAERAAALVTVIAGSGADAEWLATAIAASGGVPDSGSILGDAAVSVTDRFGVQSSLGGFERFLR
jgi:thiamine biosynthesis lipoprotein